MYQIRRGVFETNSSSSHSIAVRKIDGYYTDEEIDESFPERTFSWWNGRFHIYEDDLIFGRSPFNVLTDLRDKFFFVVASVGEDATLRKEAEDVLYEKVNGLKKIVYPIDRDDNDKEYTIYGYIDHQDVGLLQSFLKENNVTIREFLLNKKYVVFIDGDEYCITNKLVDSGIINKDNFEIPPKNY